MFELPDPPSAAYWLSVSVRAAYAIERIGIKTRGEMWEFLNDPEWEDIVLSYPNAGRKTVNELRRLKENATDPNWWGWMHDRRDWKRGN